MTLSRPAGLSDDEWAVIREAEDRLHRARTVSDFPLIVGSAKELCEAIAKVVVAERGGVLGGGAAMPELITAAHRALEHQPGEGLANDPETRRIAQGLKSVVLGLGELRNRHGTGHGHAAPTGITSEHADLAFDAGMMWGGWALMRLEPYIAGGVTALVRDLEALVFHRGELARRLVYANLPQLPVEEQMRLGVAVARRASSGTFVVMEDGIEAVRASDATTWPPGYIEGVVTGLFFDNNGNLNAEVWKVRESARLLAELFDSATVLRRLEQQVASAVASYGWVSDEAVREAAIEELNRTAGSLSDGESRDLWTRIAEHLRAGDDAAE